MTLLDLRHLTGQGVTKGSGLVFKPLANLAMRFGSGSAASSAGAAAAAVEEEANMEVLAEALKQKEEAEQEQETAQAVCMSCQDCIEPWNQSLQYVIAESLYLLGPGAHGLACHFMPLQVFAPCFS